MYYQRYLQQKIMADKSRKKVKLLLGPRQSGKSTLLKHCIAEKKNVLFINLQDRRERTKYERETAVFLQEIEALTDVSTICIDEIQKVPELLDDVQFFYDKNVDQIDFFITGSSARKLKQHSANLLPGRTHLFHMSPVLQAEQRNAMILPLDMEEGARFPVRLLEDILTYGCLPGLYSEAADSWIQTLTTYTELYLEQEIRSENSVKDMSNFLMFLKIAAIESGQTVNYSKLASQIGVSVNTVKNYYQLLEDTFVGLRIPAFGRTRKKAVVAPRFVLFDLGIRNVLAQLPMNHNLVQLDAGHLFEQFVLIELYYRCQYYGKSHQLSTWRTRSGAEVDAVVETPEEVIPVEIKWTDKPHPSDIRHLTTFLNVHSDMAHQAYLVCRVDRPRKLSEQVTAVPWNMF